ncbi:SDR family NAD(P)-dependent oxidoreductase [Streptomyces sp. 4N509B]|uniref:SDR family NAD(P)-dependent oxidoreductase n=1 Tax=Streptomyces sp. 4N509B TaxID=3457413 RepID=UPI003FD455D6
MDLGLHGRTALVTGASSGIGEAIAVALGAEGARVALTYRSGADRADAVARRVREAGGEALPLPLDLTDHATIDAAVAAVRDRWGGIDTLVANAVEWPRSGPPRRGLRFEDADPADWQSELRANLDGTMATVRAALPAMRGRADGRVVLLSSGIAEEGVPGAWSYGAAKAGLHGFARCLAWDLGQEGILVNTVAVGFTLTRANRDRMPADVLARTAASTLTHRLSDPEDVAALVTFLGSPANRSVTGEAIREGSSTTRSAHGVLL